MYNKEKKMQYAKYCRENGDTRNDKYFEYMFNYCEEFEIRFGKDVSEFELAEILEMYSEPHKFKTLNTLIVKHSQYSRYAAWANKDNNYKHITRRTLTHFVNTENRDKHIVLRQDVLSVVEKIPNCMDQFLILGIFEGLKSRNFEDLLNLKIEDVDLKNRYVLIRNRPDKFVPISNELASIINKCETEREFVNADGRTFIYDHDDYVYKYRGTIDDIRKLEPTDRSHKIRVHYIYITKGTRLEDISTVDLQESGKIWFVNEMARIEGVTGLQFMDDSKTNKQLVNQYGISFFRKGLFIRKYRDYLE